MRLDCANVEEAIWRCKRDAIELTDDELAHIEQCDSCKQALTEARASVEALDCLRPYPPAPDCRRQVLSQINSTRPVAIGLRLAWAAVPVALAAAMLLALHPGSPVERRLRIPTGRPTDVAAAKRHSEPRSHRSNAVMVVQNRRQARHRIMASPSKTAFVPPCINAVAHPRPARPKQSGPPEAIWRRLSDEVALVNEQLRLAIAEDEARRRASLTSPPETAKGEASYDYTEEDQKTGTTKHIRKTGESIDIWFETPPQERKRAS